MSGPPTSTGGGPAVVLPAAAGGPLLEGCLAALRAQDVPLAEIVLVDDSADATLPAPAGVHVRRSGGRGPYAARNVGWRATTADVVLFVDVRSRPGPGWAGALVALMADPGVAIAGSDTRVLSGPRLAERAAAAAQPFALGVYLAEPDFRPYLPNCNMAVRRADLEAVDGFDEGRSGGDADLCWRILERDGRRLATTDDPLMEWVPRTGLRDFVEQHYRYGRSNVGLRRAWADRGATPQPPPSRRALVEHAGHVAMRAGAALVRRDGETAVRATHELSSLAYRAGMRRAHRG